MEHFIFGNLIRTVNMLTIKVKEFSKTPGARYKEDGLFSGEEFFENKLDSAFNKAIVSEDQLTVDLDGTTGYASSFLSEAFGLLSEKYTPPIVLKNIRIISNEEPDWKDIILKDYIPNATKRKKRHSS